MTNENVRFTNKSWARKAMTILVDKRVEFKTIYEYTGVDGYRIGLEYIDQSGANRKIWPDGDMLVDVIRTSV